MAAERKLTVVLAGESKGLTSALGKAEKSTGRFGSKIGGLGTKAKLALAGAGTAVVAFAKSSVDAYVEAEQSQARLEDAFAKFPALAGGNIDALRALNTELMKKTRFDDDALASGQAVIAQFGLTAKQIESVTPLIADYAAKTGKDIPTASKLIGKALLGNTRALKDIGINYKSTGDKAKDLENIQRLLSQQVGGFAEKEGKTAAGQAAIMKNQFGELQETIGSKLVPVLLTLATFITGRVLPVLGSIGSWLGEHKPVLIAVAGVIGVGLVAAFVSWATAAWAAATATLAATWPVIAIAAAIAALVAGVIYAYTHWGWFRSAVDAVARFLTQTLWPAIQTIVRWLGEHLAPVVQRVASFFTNTLWPAMQTVAGFITGTLIPTVQNIISKIGAFASEAGRIAMVVVGAFQTIVNFFSGLAGTLGGLASAAWNSLKNGLEAVVRWVLGKIDTMLGPLDEVLGKLAGLRSSAGIQDIANRLIADTGYQRPDGRAAGGPVSAGSTYLVGERGPELLTMGANGFVTPNHALGGQTVIYDLRGAIISSESEFDRMVAQAGNRNARKGIR